MSLNVSCHLSCLKMSTWQLQQQERVLSSGPQRFAMGGGQSKEQQTIILCDCLPLQLPIVLSVFIFTIAAEKLPSTRHAGLCPSPSPHSPVAPRSPTAQPHLLLHLTLDPSSQAAEAAEGDILHPL